MDDADIAARMCEGERTRRERNSRTAEPVQNALEHW